MVEGLGLGLGLGGSPGPQGWVDRGPAAHFPAPPLGSWPTWRASWGRIPPFTRTSLLSECSLLEDRPAQLTGASCPVIFLIPPPLSRSWGGNGTAEAQNSKGEKLQRGLEVAEDPRALGVSSWRAGEGAGGAV